MYQYTERKPYSKKQQRRRKAKPHLDPQLFFHQLVSKEGQRKSRGDRPTQQQIRFNQLVNQQQQIKQSPPDFGQLLGDTPTEIDQFIARSVAYYQQKWINSAHKWLEGRTDQQIADDQATMTTLVSKWYNKSPSVWIPSYKHMFDKTGRLYVRPSVVRDSLTYQITEQLQRMLGKPVRTQPLETTVTFDNTIYLYKAMFHLAGTNLTYDIRHAVTDADLQVTTSLNLRGINRTIVLIDPNLTVEGTSNLTVSQLCKKRSVRAITIRQFIGEINKLL